MAVTLNLLPTELAVGKNLARALKTIRALGVILLAVFIMFIVGVSAFFIFESINLKNITNDMSDLGNQIKAQETSEQQIVLLKNRIGKIVILQKQPNSSKNLSAIEPFLATLPGNTPINELNVDSQKITLSLTFKSNSALSTFFSSLNNTSSFKSVVLSSFGFNPVSGYLLGLNISL